MNLRPGQEAIYSKDPSDWSQPVYDNGTRVTILRHYRGIPWELARWIYVTAKTGPLAGKLLEVNRADLQPMTAVDRLGALIEIPARRFGIRDGAHGGSVSESVETTWAPTARVPHQARWLTFRESRECRAADGPRTWIFTDGSSKGGFGAVLVRPGQDVRRYSGYCHPTHTKNVGAELNGMLLGLQQVGADTRVTIVSDYLGIAAWMTGNWRIKDTEVRGKITSARLIVREKRLAVDWCHHKGHQRDTSEFTRYNAEADRLAGMQHEATEEDQFLAGMPTHEVLEQPLERPHTTTGDDA